MPADPDLAMSAPAMASGPTFEALSPGDPLPSIETPPLSTAHLVRWCGAAENWHRIHYDHPFAVGHEGLPDVIVPGTLKQQVLYRLLKDWAGPRGWVLELEYQFRGQDVPGDRLVASGHVTRTFERSGYGFVECAVLLHNPGRSGPSASGRGLVVLPLRHGPSVPHPFPPALAPDLGGENLP